MGQKVNPIGFRLGINRTADSRWYADSADFGRLLHEDLAIRKSIRELADELDPRVFVQVHRSVIVNLREVSQVVRGANETAELHLHHHDERLPVSRSYLHLFKQM